jgi:hypothetical protein
MVGVGSVIGLAVAYRARTRGQALDPWLITTRWSLVGGLLGGVWLVYEAVR